MPCKVTMPVFLEFRVVTFCLSTRLLTAVISILGRLLMTCRVVDRLGVIIVLVSTRDSVLCRRLGVLTQPRVVLGREVIVPSALGSMSWID